jgi:parvulin-like peptidyl-prolyl isomerase
LPLAQPSGRQQVLLLAMMLLAMPAIIGCNGKSVKEENPVFAPAPPRRSLVNHSADAEERRLAQIAPQSNVSQTGFERSSDRTLSGTTIVANVNGKPVFVDDVLGGGRQVIERDPRLTDERRQMVIEATIRNRLPKHIEDELIVQALELKIPKDKRDSIRQSLEPKFKEVLEHIKQKEGFTTDQELDERLASEGISISQLRDTFVRTQMVEGYVSSMCKVPETIDRELLVKYYQENLSRYTAQEEVRFSEIVIRFRDHGGSEGAEQAMANVVQQLESGRDFGEVAQSMSDTLSAEKRGDMGWIKRGSLSDKKLEAMLFEMPKGTLSHVLVQNDRCELYRVTDRRNPGTTPFQEVQKEIEATMLGDLRETARAEVRKNIREKGNVVTIFDSEPQATQSDKGDNRSSRKL